MHKPDPLRIVEPLDKDHGPDTTGVCSVAGCARSYLAHCAKCRREICGHHSEYCECCAETFCPTCYVEHARESCSPLAA
jgi:hypothetical protein